MNAIGKYKQAVKAHQDSAPRSPEFNHEEGSQRNSARAWIDADGAIKTLFFPDRMSEDFARKFGEWLVSITKDE